MPARAGKWNGSYPASSSAYAMAVESFTSLQRLDASSIAPLNNSDKYKLKMLVAQAWLHPRSDESVHALFQCTGPFRLHELMFPKIGHVEPPLPLECPSPRMLQPPCCCRYCYLRKRSSTDTKHDYHLIGKAKKHALLDAHPMCDCTGDGEEFQIDPLVVDDAFSTNDAVDAHSPWKCLQQIPASLQTLP